jgi:hypothetical protein
VYSFRGEEAVADFENLLLQGRSALDRLTWFMTELTGNKSSNFRKLRSILRSPGNRVPHAKELVEILDESHNWFDSVFAKIESPEALRDLVGHKHALLEGMRNCFSVAFITPTQAVLFDCEIQLPGDAEPRVIMRVSRESGQYLSFAILNSLSVIAGLPRLPLNEFEPTWENKTVALADFAINEPDGSPLTENSLTLAKRTTPTGFQMVTRNFDPSIRSHAIDVSRPQR